MWSPTYRSALLDLDKAIELEPENHLFSNNRAGLLSQLGEYSLALAEHNRIEKIRPGSASQTSVGFVHYKLGNYEAALEAYNKQIASYGPNRAARDVDYHNRAVVREALGDYRGAVADYTEAIKVAKGSPAGLYLRRGYAHAYSGNMQAAREDWQAMLNLPQEKRSPLQILGSAYLRGEAKMALGDRAGAIKEFRDARAGYAGAKWPFGIVGFGQKNIDARMIQLGIKPEEVGAE